MNLRHLFLADKAGPRSQGNKETKSLNETKKRPPSDTPTLMQRKKSEKYASYHASFKVTANSSPKSCTALCFD